ncbi:hypothetical protein [Deinococcus radiotolerans]|uniref:Uncharacterized protein n=1 Tax=Deinococcus radiotolerans TaxID=1309407 RepID=A0ABQ2FKZ6_9DEIO|nr:hypothetical protein [Deinococcus radiotolerans]GGL08211.1 hypothetical protein GCM10010844_28750 [Deinococcus radiotolerans]
MTQNPVGPDLPVAPDRVLILRIWHEPGVHHDQWRASVKDGARGERRYFVSIDDCIDHLYGEMSRP